MVKEKQNVPLLRFPEFSGAWVENELEEYYPFVRNGFVGVATPFYCDYSEGVKYLQSNNIHKGVINENKIVYITKAFHQKNKKNILKLDDILMVQSGHSGECAVVNKRYVDCNCHALIILSANFKANSYFTCYSINSDRGQRSIFSLLSGNTIKHILASEVKKHKLHFPTLSEQTKIADFLSVIDERIDLLTQKKKMLETYKKGVMQKLFSQELRFKDENGNNYPDWTNEIFGNIYTFYPTNSYSRDCLNMTFGYVKNIHYGDIHVKYKSILNIQDEDIPFINDDIDLAKISSDSYCQDKDLLIADASEDYADIGKTVEVSDIGSQQVVSGLHTILSRPNKKEMASSFGGYMMQSENIKLQIKTIAQGTKVLGLSSKRLAEVTFKLPSIAEQQKTANFLSEIDDNIATLSDNIDSSQLYKKGLLQQMFV